jgi:hypothetical protein
MINISWYLMFVMEIHQRRLLGNDLQSQLMYGKEQRQ